MSKKQSALGKSLIRDHKKKSHFVIKDGYRHTSDLLDGRDWGRLNLHSITEQSSLDDFLNKAELAEHEYNEEFSNIQIVEPNLANGILTDEEKSLVNSAQEKNRDILCIPRRPFWDINTSKEELDAKEREEFLDWRRKLSQLQEEEHINLTPYEKNLEIWRQLWRVIERSDVVVQIIDARNPILFRCPDLEAYVKEVEILKLNVILMNKADFLTDSERQCWSDWFENAGIKVIFFSALQEIQRDPEAGVNGNVPNSLGKCDQDMETSQPAKPETETVLDDSNNNNIHQFKIKNSAKILSSEELAVFLKEIGRSNKTDDSDGTVIGLVGYPNVGKSSTINALLMSKKVCVSATPGKTKHFQTHIIDKDLCLCDCPGLVFPNFVSTKADMVINGILPIDQLTNWVQPVSLVTNLIPRDMLEATYSVIIPQPDDGNNSKCPPTAEEFLNAYGYNRGFMTQRGLPDNARSSRYILKDFVKGKLLYCYAPPGVKQEDYHKFTESQTKKKSIKSSTENQKSAVVITNIGTEADRKFFSKVKCQVHTKGIHGNAKGAQSDSTNDVDKKPWKKHHNRNKKEKLRRLASSVNPYD